MECTNCTDPPAPTPAQPPMMPAQPPMMPPSLPDWFIISTMATLSVCALLGNTLVIFCFIRFRRKLKQNTVAYLISLAVSDLWIGFMIGIGILSVVYKRWVLGSFLCQASAFVNNVALINSLWTVALGSVDRCVAIRIPFRHRTIITKNRLMMLIMGTWCYAMLLSLPPLLHIPHLKYMFSPAHPWCAMSSNHHRAYFIVFSLGFLPLPILIILTSYIVIFVTTRRYTRRQLDRIGCDRDLRDRINSCPCPESLVRVPDDTDEMKPISASYDTLKQRCWIPSSQSPKSNENLYTQVRRAIIQKLFSDGPSPDGTRMTSSFIFQGSPNGSLKTSGNLLGRSSSVCIKTEEEIAAKKLRNQAGTLLVVIGTTILLSYTPIICVSTLASFSPVFGRVISYKTMQGFFLLLLSNASINPLIYFVLNKEFRLTAKCLFRDIFLPENPPVPLPDYSRMSLRTTTLSSHTLPSLTSDPASRPNSTSDPLQKQLSETVLLPKQQYPVVMRAKPTTAEKIDKHVLRSSLILNADMSVVSPMNRKLAKRSTESGLINFSFYEVESAL